MNLAQTVAFVQLAHYEQTDLAGVDYWFHPLRVMNSLGPAASLEAQQVALLHDVLEDTGYTAGMLLAAGFAPAVVEAVQLLTRPAGVTYPDYVQALAASGNQLAVQVKLADLADNLSPARPHRTAKLTARYQAAQAMLSKE
jgi:(p)ppGpp synthase/HD superfamily hydrolase